MACTAKELEMTIDFVGLQSALIQKILLEFQNRSNDVHAEPVVQLTTVFIRALAHALDDHPLPPVKNIVSKATDVVLLHLYPDLAQNAERRKTLVKARNAIIENTLAIDRFNAHQQNAFDEMEQWLTCSQSPVCFGATIGGLLVPYGDSVNKTTLGLLGQNIELHLRSLAAHVLQEKRLSISGRETIEIDLISLSRQLFDYLIKEIPEPATSDEIVVLAMLFIADTYKIAHYERLYGEKADTNLSGMEIGNLYKTLNNLGGRVLIGIETRGPIDSATLVEAQKRVTDTFMTRTKEYNIREWTKTMLNPAVTSDAAFHTDSLLTDFGKNLNWGKPLSEHDTLHIYQTLLQFVLDKRRKYQDVTTEEFQGQVH
jgi:hypothetical protein